MTSEKGCRKEKNQNIQVFVRLRPLNQRERDIKSLGVVEVVNNREVVVRQSQQTSLTKKFTFDRAFGPNTKQVEVYQDVVSPLIEEVLAGYNCTVFAYGQTGTGKTHTMVGEHTGVETTWQNDPLAGIIPRALSQLFDELRISNTEYTVRVSYLELYNEELFDLLSTSEDNSKLRIYEDVTRKGSNIVNGLEEITVYNKNEVYKIMAQGQERKRVASTLMNAQSSRSHTVFTIVVHMKENSPEGEELVKIGKLNLVDLAGSENISKAGSDNPAKRERARECVNINQSLLTLGRVITALVERHPHIPYRESKLTRILQESLGGRTKTSIIATISPGHKDLEETMSTLEYAHRAKNIQNKPEINQKMTKKAILKEYAEEIDRLKRDLQAARDKSGVYLANETYAEMTLKQEEQRKEIQELLMKKKAMEDERDRMVNVFADLNKMIEARESELNETKNKLNNTKVQLTNTNNLLRSTRLQCEEKEQLVQAHAATEQQLSQQALQLLHAADTASQHLAALHDNVDKRKTLESTNLEVTRTYREESSQQRSQIYSNVQQFTESFTQTLNGLLGMCENYTSNSSGIHTQNKQKIELLVQKIVNAISEMKTATTEAHSQLLSSSEQECERMVSVVANSQEKLQQAIQVLVVATADAVQRALAVDATGNVAKFVHQWYTSASSRVSSLHRAHSLYSSGARAREERRHDSGRRGRRARAHLAADRSCGARARIAEIKQEKALLETRLTKQLADIETERRETEERLNEWMEEERRLLEERLARHVATEKRALEIRLKKKIEEIEQEQMDLEERIAKHIKWQEMQLQADEELVKMAEAESEECEIEKEEVMKTLNKYEKEFDEGAKSISVDMEVFSKNVVEVVEHLVDQLLDTIRRVDEQTKQSAESVVSTGGECMQVVRLGATAALQTAAAQVQQTLRAAVQNVEENNANVIQELNELATATDKLESMSLEHLRAQSTTAAAACATVTQFESAAQQALQRHEELEARYLLQEYRVYTPSGATPLRSQPRYPRNLVATSPHERILARYRAQRQDPQDDDCVIVVESEGEGRTASDTESSASEDSAVVFAAPSPPERHTHHPIVKSTSETDIYIYRKQQDQTGKENANRSISHKKPSKLPAPTSVKKPLVERNAIN